MWWLLFRDGFRDGGVVIIRASSLVHARLLAAASGLGKASHFVEGNFIETEHLPPIPPEFVGRMLSPVEARQLVESLNRKPRDPAGPERRRGAKPRPQS